MKSISSKALSLALSLAMVLSMFSGIPLFGSVTAYADSLGESQSELTAYSDGFSLYKDSSNAQEITTDKASITTVVFEDGVDFINLGPIVDCNNLRTVAIPSSVTNIVTNTFSGFTHLSNFEVASGNKDYSSQDDVLYNNNDLFFCPIAKTGQLDIRNGTTKIDSYAFDECELSSINIPNSVKEIGQFAFLDCTNLTSAVLPDSVQSIGQDTFFGCTSLTSVVLPLSITHVGNEAFRGCTALKNVTTPDQPAFGTNSFYGDTLNNLYIVGKSVPANLCSSNNTFFFQASTDGYELTKYYGTGEGVIKPASLYNKPVTSSIPVKPAAYCNGKYLYMDPDCTIKLNYSQKEKIQTAIVKDGVTSIQNDTFSNCSKLTSVTIPEGVQTIGDQAFANCSSLVSLALPESITSIGKTAFMRCCSLTSLTIPKNVISIGDNAFVECDSLLEIKIETGNSTFGFKDGLLYTIGSTHNLLECLTNKSGEVVIPAEIQTVDARAFVECFNVTKISVANGNQSFSSESGILYNHDKTELICCPEGMAGEVAVAQSTQKIDEGAFYACQITGITLSENLQSIGGFSFEGCAALTDLTIPSTAAVDEYAFYGTNGNICLDNLYIFGATTPVNLPSAKNTFYFDKNQNGGYQLKSYTGNGVNRVIPTKLFSKDISPKITEDQLTTTDTTVYCDENGLKKSVDDTSYLDMNDPYHFTVTKVQFADNISKIPAGAFENCVCLSKIDIPASVTSIGGCAFAGCTALKEITIPAKVSNIMDGAFEGCASLSAINVADGNTSYCGKEGILYSKDLTSLVACPPQKTGSVELPDSLTAICPGAFMRCNKLTEITIPSNVATIGEEAFCECEALAVVRFKGTVKTFGFDAFEKQREDSSTTFVIPTGTEAYYTGVFNSVQMEKVAAKIVTAKQIASFDALQNSVKIQNISIGSQPTLPSTLSATVNNSTQAISGVTWASTPAYQSNEVGTYVFTPTLPVECEYDATALPKITVNVVQLSSAKAITAFSIGGNTGVISETNHTVTVTVPYGTNVTELTPTITVSNDATVSPVSGAKKDFTNPVTYTVTAKDGSSQNYVVTVTVTANSNSDSNSSSHSSGNSSSNSSQPTNSVTTSTTPAGVTVATVVTTPTTVPVVTGNKSEVTVTVPSDVASIVTSATSEKPAHVAITVPTAAVVEQLQNSAVHTADLTISVPAAIADQTNQNAAVTITAEQAVLQAAKDTKKDVTLSVVNSDTGKLAYSWTFKGADLANATALKNIDIQTVVRPTEDVPTVNKGTTPTNKGLVLEFASNGVLPGSATVKVYVGDKGYKVGQTLYFYYYNSATKQLEPIGNSMYTVDSDGDVSVTISHCSDYVLLPKQANSLMLDTLSYTMTPKSSYGIGTRVVAPKGSTLKTYSTNSNVASVTVLKNGSYKITGVKSGTAYIMFDVYDNKNKLLTHASVRIDVKTGIRPRGDSTRQIATF